MHFICSALVRRLSTRDRMETDDEKRVPDIVEEPLHISLDNLATAAATSSTVYHTLEGPADDEGQTTHNATAIRFATATRHTSFRTM
jgi:hypothetical protein